LQYDAVSIIQCACVDLLPIQSEFPMDISFFEGGTHFVLSVCFVTVEVPVIRVCDKCGRLVGIRW